MSGADTPFGDSADWQARMAGLTYACAQVTGDQASGDQAAELLREGWRLLVNPPPAWRGSINLGLDELAFEALLDAGGADAAALALLNGWAGFMLSHGPGARHMATVIVEGRTDEASADGVNAALALLGAMAAALSGADLTDGRGNRPARRDPGLWLN